jgi:hypothetical protein
MMQNQELEKENQYVLLHTEMGNGVDFMMYSHAWHGKAPNDTQLEIVWVKLYRSRKTINPHLASLKGRNSYKLLNKI